MQEHLGCEGDALDRVVGRGDRLERFGRGGLQPDDRLADQTGEVGEVPVRRDLGYESGRAPSGIVTGAPVRISSRAASTMALRVRSF